MDKISEKEHWDSIVVDFISSLKAVYDQCAFVKTWISTVMESW